MDKFPNYAPKGVPKVIRENPNKPEFNFDCVTDIKRVDPLTPRFTGFNWDAVSESLGELENEDTDRDLAQIASKLGEILRWIVKGDDLKTIGRRAVVLQSAIEHSRTGGTSSPLIRRKIR